MWQNAVDKDGYPLGQLPKYVLGAVNRRQQRIGRKVCEAVHGPQPRPGMVAMHSCDTPGCVDGAHLHWGTPKENTHDSVRKGRWARTKYSRETLALVVALRGLGLSLRDVSQIACVPLGTIGNMVLPGYRKVA